MIDGNKLDKTVVFVYGNFNILHPGHLRLLKFARESGDYLIVAVNSNELAKSSNLFDEKIRLESVQSTSFVNEAFILKENVIEYIAKLKPDIIVKGKEHEQGENPEESILAKYGGKLLFTSGEIGFSSLDLLQREFGEITYSDIEHSMNYVKRHGITRTKLQSIVEKFSTLKVLVVGDTIVDEYITCDPIGMSQEDPTIVVTPLSKKNFVGGAAIVAAHATTLGAHVHYISVIGDDESGRFVLEKLKNFGIKTDIFVDSTRPTTLKQRFRANGKTLLRVNHLKQHNISRDFENKILKIVEDSKDEFDLIVFSDFSYGVLTHKVIESISDIAQSNNICMAADSQSSSQIGDISKFKNMDIVTPTEREIRLSLNDFSSGLVVLSEKLHHLSHPSYIFTTLGSEGLVIYNSHENELLTDNIPALNHNPKDVSGAGDSLLVCSAMAYRVDASIWESAYLGSLAAAIQVSRMGNIPIRKDELIKEIDLL